MKAVRVYFRVTRGGGGVRARVGRAVGRARAAVGRFFRRGEPGR